MKKNLVFSFLHELTLLESDIHPLAKLYIPIVGLTRFVHLQDHDRLFQGNG